MQAMITNNDNYMKLLSNFAQVTSFHMDTSPNIIKSQTSISGIFLPTNDNIYSGNDMLIIDGRRYQIAEIGYNTRI